MVSARPRGPLRRADRRLRTRLRRGSGRYRGGRGRGLRPAHRLRVDEVALGYAHDGPVRPGRLLPAWERRSPARRGPLRVLAHRQDPAGHGPGFLPRVEGPADADRTRVRILGPRPRPVDERPSLRRALRPHHCPCWARHPGVHPARRDGRDRHLLWPVRPRAARVGGPAVVGVPGRVVGRSRSVPAHHAGTGRPGGPLGCGRGREYPRAQLSLHGLRGQAYSRRDTHARNFRGRGPACRLLPGQVRGARRWPRPRGTAAGHPGVPLADGLVPSLHDRPEGRDAYYRLRPAREPARAHRRDGRVRRHHLWHVGNPRGWPLRLHSRRNGDPWARRRQFNRHRVNQRLVRPVGTRPGNPLADYFLRHRSGHAKGRPLC